MTLAVEDCNFVCTCYVNAAAYNNDHDAFVDVQRRGLHKTLVPINSNF